MTIIKKYMTYLVMLFISTMLLFGINNIAYANNYVNISVDAKDLTTITSDSDDASMLFVDYTSGSDTAGNGSKTAPYKTISKALSDVSSSRNVIYLLSTYPINTNTTITSTADVTIKRSCQNHDYLFEVTGGTLTLQNITIDGNKSSIEVAGKSLINVNGGSLSIEGATLQNNFANSGGAVRVINGTAIMSSGYISNNQAVDNGGGVMVSGTGITSFGLFAITGGTITGNNATNGSAVVFLDQNRSQEEHLCTAESRESLLLRLLSNSIIA